MNRPVACGDVFITAPTDGGMRVQIRRVARDNTWTDIRVTTQDGTTWTKRQPLRDGRLPFPSQDVAELICGTS